MGFLLTMEKRHSVCLSFVTSLPFPPPPPFFTVLQESFCITGMYTTEWGALIFVKFCTNALDSQAFVAIKLYKWALKIQSFEVAFYFFLYITLFYSLRFLELDALLALCLHVFSFIFVSVSFWFLLFFWMHPKLICHFMHARKRNGSQAKVCQYIFLDSQQNGSPSEFLANVSGSWSRLIYIKQSTNW